jgi:hypothetical protein
MMNILRNPTDSTDSTTNILHRKHNIQQLFKNSKQIKRHNDIEQRFSQHDANIKVIIERKFEKSKR